MNKSQILEDIVKSYLATAEWCEIDSDVERENFTTAAVLDATFDCNAFIERVCSEFTPTEAEAILTYQGNDVTALCGHDFWLTRNGHGAGFFDKEIYNELADNGCNRLTKIAQDFTTVGVYVNDDLSLEFM